MAQLVKPWNDGGSLTATYEGSGDGSAVFSSDTNEGIDREMEVVFVGGGASLSRKVRQEGLREEIKSADGLMFKVNDGYFGVLKGIVDNKPPYLAIEALEDGLTFTLTNSDVSYSIDGKSWTFLSAGTKSLSINNGEKIYVKANGLTPNLSVGIGRFVISKKCRLSGTPMSLIHGDDVDKYTDLTGYDYAFYRLFRECSTIKEIDADFLPATTLSTGCYYEMFYSCTGLTSAPLRLPSTTLSESCYRSMFDRCSSLVDSVKELPALELTDHCYRSMYYSCTRNTTTPEIKATKLANSSCKFMFFQNAITKAPTLYAETLTTDCYAMMFQKCNKLNYIKALFLSGAGNPTMNWVQNVATSGTFVKSKNATWTTIGNNGVPSGWTIEYE